MSKKSRKSKRKTETEREEKGKSTKSGGGSVSDQMDCILAVMYFLDWNKSILETYTQKIKELYLIPVTEHCVRKKVKVDLDGNVEQSGKGMEIARKLEAGVKVEGGNDDLKQLQRRLKDVHIDDNSAEYIPVKKEYWISLAETSVMYRLRVLVQMSGSLLVYLEKIRTWLEKHRKLLSRYSQECSEVVAFATECFEATCCQADIFSLEPVDRSKVRKDCKKHISTGDPYKDGDRVRGVKFEFKKVKEQVKVLEGQVNYYRTSVYLIGNSLTDITQAILKKIPRDILEVTTKEVRSIMERLPPAYHFPSNCKITKGTEKLLAKQPPNARRLLKVDDKSAFIQSQKSQKTKSLRKNKSLRSKKETDQSEVSAKSGTSKKSTKSLKSTKSAQTEKSKKSQKSVHSRKEKSTGEKSEKTQSQKSEGTQKSESDVKTP